MREQITLQNANQLTGLTHVRHGWITQVVWSPDGVTLAIAGADGVQLYVGKFGHEPTHMLEGHISHVKGAAFSPDSRLLASVSADTTVRLWDTSNAEDQVTEVAVLEGHQDSVDAAAFKPDGRVLATCSADGLIALWDISTYECVAVLEGHESEVATLTFGLDGNVLVSGGWDNTVRLWDVGAETQGTVIGEHDDWVRQVAVNPPGTMIASASKDSTVRLWDAHSGEEYAVVQAHGGGVDCVAFGPDGTLMATGGRDNVVRIWNLQQILRDGQASPGDVLITLEGHQKPIMSLAFNPAGTLLASGSGDNIVRLWSVGDPST